MQTRAAAWPNGRPKVEEHKSFAELAHTLANIVQAKANDWTKPTSEGHSTLTWGSKKTPIRTTELRIQAVTPHPKFQC